MLAAQLQPAAADRPGRFRPGPGRGKRDLVHLGGRHPVHRGRGTSLRPPLAAALAALAICCWAVGVTLYLVIAVMVAAALFARPVRPAELTPPYWVFMGAAAISVLAGAQLLALPPDPLGTTVRGTISGLSMTLWAFGTFLIPFLVVAGVWRHLVRRVPLAYEPGLWSIVFPVGMYGAGSRELGAALGVSWLVTLGRDEAWLALAAWALVALAMAWTLPQLVGIPRDSAAKMVGLARAGMNVTALGLSAGMLTMALYMTNWNGPAVSATADAVLSAIGLAVTIAAGFLGWTLVQDYHVGIRLAPEQELAEPAVQHQQPPIPLRRRHAA